MSRVIENDHPFSDDEVAYLASRSGGAAIIAANKRDYPAEGSKAKGDNNSGAVELDPAVVEFVKGLDEAGIDAEFEKLEITPVGTELKEKKLELAKALQAKRDAE